MAKKSKYVQHVVRSESELPTGLVHVLDAFGPSTSASYKSVSKAASKGFIESWKHGDDMQALTRGPVFVRREQAEAWLNRNESQHAATVEHAAAGVGFGQAESICEALANIELTLHEICSVLKQLTAAAESIATQPIPARRAADAICANGFHN